MVAAIEDMEMWQIAETLGCLDAPPADGRSPVRSGRDLVAERMRAARAGLPEPEPDEPTPAVLTFMDEYRRLGTG